ncbi:STAS domain-containing protein [Syntrophomonas palmitatica]|uniref:STAS domain-containing protein n=1 Tax=Syntrophomonas palmitatica TaxID=402877 RepID=UPI0006D1D8CB|nr:STAS domain-containing protein [Syntrophomonas palmitatica]
MNIQESKKGEISIFELEGRLDSVTSSQLEKSLLSRLQAGDKNLIIDFARVDYISSAGLRVLLMAAKKTRAAGGGLALSALANNVQEVFDIAGFTSIFPIYKSYSEALSSF